MSHIFSHEVYVPTSTANDQQKEQFYENLNTARRSKVTYFSSIMGDFNSKVGGEHRRNTKEKVGVDVTNNRGETLNNFRQSKKLFCMNTLFKNPDKRRQTWRSPDQSIKNEIDVITYNKNISNAIGAETKLRGIPKELQKLTPHTTQMNEMNRNKPEKAINKACKMGKIQKLT